MHSKQNFWCSIGYEICWKLTSKKPLQMGWTLDKLFHQLSSSHDTYTCKPYKTGSHHFTNLTTSINTKVALPTLDYSNYYKAVVIQQIMHNTNQRLTLLSCVHQIWTWWLPPLSQNHPIMHFSMGSIYQTMQVELVRSTTLVKIKPT